MFPGYPRLRHCRRAPVRWHLPVLGALVAAGLPAAQPPAPQGGPGRGGPGPWDQDVLVYRIGADGRAEQQATFPRAGVPTVTRLADGRLLTAFQHFPADDARHFDRVAVRFSSDEGRTWTAPQPIVVDGMERGLARPFDPTLVPLADGKVRLYFTSNRSPDFRRSTPAIYSAVSGDGVQYSFEPGVRFGLEGRVVIDCAVARHGDLFHLIVPDNGTAEEFLPSPGPAPQRGPGGAGGPGAGERPRREPPGGSGYHAVSRDGLTFERVADVRLPTTRDRWLGNLQSDGGQLVFFGTGPGPWPQVSRDGVTWTASTAAFRVPGADPGAVRLRDGSWLLVVTGPPRPGTPSALRRGPPRPPPEPARPRAETGAGGLPGR